MLKTKADFEELLTKCFKNEDIYNRLPKQIIEAYEALAVRLSDAVENFNNSNYPSKSTFGSYATGTCKFYRTDDSAELTFVSGTISLNLQIGEEITFDNDLIFASGSTESNTVGWTSVDKSYTANYYKNTLLYLKDYATDQIIFGKVLTCNEDGSNNSLSLLGYQKNIQPYDGETEARFRKRFRDIEDKITIGSVEAIVTKYFPTGYVIECFENAGPAAVPYNTGDYANELTSGSLCLDNGLDDSRLSLNDNCQAWFKIMIPFAQYTDLTLPFFCLGQTFLGQYNSHLTPVLPGIGILDVGVKKEISYMCQELNSCIAAGVTYYIEEF